MTDALAPARRRPVLITIAVVLVYIGGLSSTVTGTFILLSRYQVEPDQILAVSLLGAAVILFGLLTIAVASGVSRGRPLARLLLTLYSAGQAILHVLTVVSTASWDVLAISELIADVFILIVIWAPPGSRYFRDAPAASPAGAA